MKAGRPRIYEAESAPLRVISVRLNAIQHRLAAKLGNGNVSEGIRKILDFIGHKKGKLE